LLRNLVAEVGEAAVRQKEIADVLDREKGRAALEPDHRAVAAPSPLVRATAKAGSHRVEDDVPAHLEQVLVGLDVLGVERTLKYVAVELVAPVEVPGERAVYDQHPFGQVRRGRLDQQMRVVRHQAVGVEAPPAALDCTREMAQVREVIAIVVEERRSTISTRRHVVERSGLLETVSPGHAATVRPQPIQQGCNFVATLLQKHWRDRHGHPATRLQPGCRVCGYASLIAACLIWVYSSIE
jgi:hypothetical protein